MHLIHACIHTFIHAFCFAYIDPCFTGKPIYSSSRLPVYSFIPQSHYKFLIPSITIPATITFHRLFSSSLPLLLSPFLSPSLSFFLSSSLPLLLSPFLLPSLSFFLSSYLPSSLPLLLSPFLCSSLPISLPLFLSSSPPIFVITPMSSFFTVNTLI